MEGLSGGFTAGDKITHQAHRESDQHYRSEEQKYQQAGVAPGGGLALEKTRMSHVSEPQKATLGT